MPPLPRNYLVVTMKYATTKKNGLKGYNFRTEIITDNKDINNDDVISYEFKNLGLNYAILNNTMPIVPALPAGVILEEYGHIDTWKPLILDGEFDTTIYKVKFLGTLP